MANFMAQMLDELMGKDRDLLPDEASRDKGFDDEDICKHFLCGFCPHDLFTNCKTDLGPCLNIHDEALVEKYKKSSKYRRLGYEEDFLRYLQSIRNDCEKRIKRANQRLAQAPNQNLGNPRTSSLQIIENKITQLLEKVESLGNEGKVEEAHKHMQKIDQLRKDKEALQSNVNVENTGEKQMEVCNICGAFLIVGDAPTRVEDHLKGKQHTGFAKVRSTIAQLRLELYNIREDDVSGGDQQGIRGRSSSGSPRRRHRSSSSDHEFKRTTNRHQNEDYSELLQRESDRRNIQPDEVAAVSSVKHRKHSRMRSSRSRSRSRKRTDRDRDDNRNHDRGRRDGADSSKSRRREGSQKRDSREKQRKSHSRDRKTRKESSKRTRRSRSRSRERRRSRSAGNKRRRHSSGDESGEQIEVKIPINDELVDTNGQ